VFFSMLHTIGRRVMTRHDASWRLMTGHDPSWNPVVIVHDASWRLTTPVMTRHDPPWPMFMTRHDASWTGSRWPVMTRHDASGNKKRQVMLAMRSWLVMVGHGRSRRVITRHDRSLSITQFMTRHESSWPVMHDSWWLMTTHGWSWWRLMIRHDQPWPVMIHHDASWRFVIRPDRSWPVMARHGGSWSVAQVAEMVDFHDWTKEGVKCARWPMLLHLAVPHISIKQEPLHCDSMRASPSGEWYLCLSAVGRGRTESAFNMGSDNSIKR